MKEKIPNEIFKHVSIFENITFYHTKHWHTFLKKTFCREVKVIIGLLENKELI